MLSGLQVDETGIATLLASVAVVLMVLIHCSPHDPASVLLPCTAEVIACLLKLPQRHCHNWTNGR